MAGRNGVAARELCCFASTASPPCCMTDAPAPSAGHCVFRVSVSIDLATRPPRPSPRRRLKVAAKRLLSPPPSGFGRKRLDAEKYGLRKVLPKTGVPHIDISESAENDETSAGLADVKSSGKVSRRRVKCGDTCACGLIYPWT